MDESEKELAERMGDMAIRGRAGIFDSLIRAELALEGLGNPEGVYIAQIPDSDPPQFIILNADGSVYFIQSVDTEISD